MTTARSILLPVAAVVLAMACFQLGAAVAKGLFPTVGPQGAAALRLGLGAVILLAIARPWRQRRWGLSLPTALLGLSVAGAVGFFYLAIGRLPLGVAIALQFLGPLGVALAGSRRPRDLAWAVLAAAGVWGLIGPSAGEGRFDLLGVAWALGAAACWAAYILSGRIAGAASGQTAAALSTVIAAVLVLPVGWLHAGSALFDPAILPLALLVALLATAIPFSLELWSLPRLPARTFAVFTSLEPAFGALFGLVVLHERLAWSQLAGLVGVMAAAAGAAWSHAEEPAAVVT